MALLGLLLQGLSQGCNHLWARDAVSSEGSTAEHLLPSSFTRFLEGFSFSQAVGLKIHFILNCWLEASLEFLPRGSHNMAVGFIRASERARERVNRMEVTVFCNLITEVTSHHFCHSLVIRIKSLSPACTLREGMNTRRRGSMRVISESC